MEETLQSAASPESYARRHWWVFLITGIFWLIVAFVLLRFNATSAFTVGLMAGAVVLLAAINEFVSAAWSSHLRWFRIALGVLYLAIGIVAIVYPGKTFLIIAAVFAWYLLIKGTFDVVKALVFRPMTDAWWLLLIVGLLQIALGFWAAGFYQGSALLVVAWVGIAALLRGIGEIVEAVRLKRGPVAQS
jgi:uncharacterized membrane protein HdeD (DUF308 family)